MYVRIINQHMLQFRKILKGQLTVPLNLINTTKEKQALTFAEQLTAAIEQYRFLNQHLASSNVQQKLLTPIIESLKAPITLLENEECIHNYRQLLITILPEVKTKIENQEFDALEQLVSKTVTVKPSRIDRSTRLKINKVYLFLTDPVRPETKAKGYQIADSLSKEFLKDWVTIKAHQMSALEIKLLVRIGCYYENSFPNSTK